MLDIGARDFVVAKRFAEIGYTVDAIDPDPPATIDVPPGINFFKCTLEAFDATKCYDLVLALRISHHVNYDLSDFLRRLISLASPGGLIYVTLLGNEDGWAAKSWAKATTFETACRIICDLGLRPLYRSVEWFDGYVYSGDQKFWHLYRFILER